MEETLISFKTAKLAKEKGFREYCFYCYDKLGKLEEPYTENGSSTDIEFRVDLTDLLDNYNFEHNFHIQYSAPTQSLLQKWLREKHKLEVHVSFNPDWDFNKETDECLCVNKGYRVDWGFVGIWKKYNKEAYPLERRDINTYEEALEVGLFEALKLIK